MIIEFKCNECKKEVTTLIYFRMERMIEISTKKDDIILDPFAGSGTTLVATKKLQRNLIGIEISKEYCAIAQKHLDALPERLTRWF